ncbi:unnamed protein product [Brassica rapa]|uniref:Uncharacterized protein n=1 Tax=Brassica campestris TaxID=3711 RepID=A0A3P5Y6E4_BRACM|nr:unnamed protein product [Brassica rapa]VDC62957.1 unnamed protein product [Brassica rapa]
MLSSTFVYKHVSCLCFSVCQESRHWLMQPRDFLWRSRVADQPIFRSQIIVVEAGSSIQLSWRSFTLMGFSITSVFFR